MGWHAPIAVMPGQRGGRFALWLAIAFFLVMAGCKPAREPAPPAPALQADHILVVKHQRALYLIHQGVMVRHYQVALGHDPIGHKQREGDGRTPEGRYRIDWRNPASRFHLSLHISYPDDVDVARAENENVLAGGDIMIHGLPNGMWWLGELHREIDWTEGCIAVTDEEIEEIWNAVADGTTIDILP